MPRFRPQARAVNRAIAALLPALALLSGCFVAGTPDEGGLGGPNPFALGLPTPTNTLGVPDTPSATLTPQETAPTAAPAASPTTGPPATPIGTPGTGAPSTATAAPTAAPTETAAPVETAASTASTTPSAPSTSLPGVQATPTASPTETAASTASPTTSATRTRVFTVVPANTPTSPPTAPPAPTSTAAAASTWTPVPTPTPEEPVSWNLARDVIGMWEFADGEEWRYYFDFLPGGRAIVAQNGLRPYRVQGARTLVIQMPENEWSLTVVDLTADRLLLKNFVNETDEFRRVPGTPALASKIVGLWLDESGVYPSIEFTADGLAAGAFGRGTYDVPSGSSVLLTCDRPQDCDPYRAYPKDPGAPPALRVHEVTGTTLTVEGFGSNQLWTLTYREGIPDLAGRLVGRWVREVGSIEFREDGGVVLDDSIYGRYEVLGRSTVWTKYDDEEQGQSLVVFRLTQTELALAEWGAFYEDDLWTFDRSTP